jgi:hypothetical protein
MGRSQTQSKELCVRRKTVTEYSFAKPPEPVGYWILDPQGLWKTQFAMYSKPTDEQIKNTEELLGWKWKDAK